MNEYKVLRKLGEGGQGTTFCAQRLKDGKSFALKQIVCASIAEANFALQEAKTLNKLEHPGIVKYEDVFLHEKREESVQKLVVCIVMEYCERGDLAHAIRECKLRNQTIPQHVVVRWLKNIFAALSFLHSQKLMHRDLKGMNIFISRDGTLKLGDFGLARQVTRDVRSKVGTPCYLAPEVLQSDTYAEPADVWGAGCIALEITQLSFLFERKGVLAMQVLTQPVTPADVPATYPTALRNLIAGMLHKQPERRPTIKQCLDIVTPLQQGGAPNNNNNNNNNNNRKPSGEMPKQANPVQAAVEAAKAAAQQAALAAQQGVQAIQDKLKGDQNRNNNLQPPPPPPQQQQQQHQAPTKPPPPPAPAPRAAPADARHAAAPPPRATGLETHDVEGYERALAQSRRELGPEGGGEGDGYRLVQRDGLEVYIGDADLAGGVAPFEQRGLAGEALIAAAMRNRGFYDRYVGGEEKRAMVEERMRRLLRDREVQRQQAQFQGNGGREGRGEGARGGGKKERTWGSFRAGVRGKLHEAKEAVLAPLQDVAAALKFPAEPRPAESEQLPAPAPPSESPIPRSPARPPADPHGNGQAMADLLRAMSDGDAPNRPPPPRNVQPPPRNVPPPPPQRDDGAPPRGEEPQIGRMAGWGHAAGAGGGGGGVPGLVAAPQRGPGGGAGGGGEATVWPGAESFPAAGLLSSHQRAEAQTLLRTAHAAETVVMQAEDRAGNVTAVQAMYGGYFKGVAEQNGAAGLGVLLQGSGARYAGQFKNGRYEGLGGLEHADKSRYLGQFAQGEYSGVGRLWLAGGGEYCGRFSSGRFHGWGCLVQADGKVRSGVFAAGELHDGAAMLPSRFQV